VDLVGIDLLNLHAGLCRVLSGNLDAQGL